ncbi:MAG: PaaI family thioesterase [Wenzhouxiangellaceae bacterium]
MEDLKKLATSVLQSQPFSVLLAVELVSIEPGKAVLAVPLKDEYKQQHGFAHGGIISYLADNSLTFAGGSMLDGNAVTSEFKINYLRPALGERLIARARAVNAGKQQAVCQCEIFCVSTDGEKLCAVAQGTIVRVE